MRSGYIVHSMWECQLNTNLRLEPELKHFFDNCGVRFGMDVREALYGGRTNCRKMAHKIKHGERISYIDVTSLYPFINKYGTFPVGHPTVITENFQPVNKESRPYDGIIKCTVIPPTNLLHPVLPVRFPGKLLFPLCNACATDRYNGECEHDDDQRQFTGAWPTCELYKAIELGYTV